MFILPQPSDDLLSRFAAKAGEWECDACYTRNPADSGTCLACQTPKPTSVQSSEISSSSSEPKEADKPVAKRKSSVMVWMVYEGLTENLENINLVQIDR